VTVTFRPIYTGTRTSTLRIYSDDPDTSPANVTLTGVGTY
jgi:hypothetical protein